MFVTNINPFSESPHFIPHLSKLVPHFTPLSVSPIFLLTLPYIFLCFYCIPRTDCIGLGPRSHTTHRLDMTWPIRAAWLVRISPASMAGALLAQTRYLCGHHLLQDMGPGESLCRLCWGGLSRAANWSSILYTPSMDGSACVEQVLTLASGKSVDAGTGLVVTAARWWSACC